MENVLAWQSLIFHVPLAVGVLLALGSAVGMGDAEADAELDADVDVDANPLEAGRVPLNIVLMIGTLLFGGMGVVLNTLLAPHLPNPLHHAPISALLAGVGSVVLTGRCARLLARLLPSSETYRVSRRDLVGRSGMLVLAASTSGGLAQVKDHEGNVHQVRCRSLDGPLAKGTEIVVVEHHAPDNTYVVAALDH